MSLVQIAGLLADQTRAAFCLALLDGRAWTAGELARHAGVSQSTASEHLSRLTAGGLLTEVRQGRHRYVRLAGPAVADLLEDLASFSPSTPSPQTLRESTRMSAEARARTCYDHLAGHLGVVVSDALLNLGLVVDRNGLSVSERGLEWFADLGVSLPARRRSRPVVRSCLDWTERRTHLGGAAGAALCRTAFERQWVERIGSGRALRITPSGDRAFRELLALDIHSII
ncbi:ArsR/SmtB family transcription factor [Actinopolymorpha alba]|uniref:ArsR/SmtB family transcription factor n=1 Tax=Actinopolymorpha alba TaxID=533267 RepID=UPI00035F5E34|nr:winged helix-turn-helix domain-containing protein [Actinopolymorpha alba]